MKIKSLEDKFRKLESLGFKTPNHCTIRVEGIPIFYQKAIEWRKELNYDIDGLVFSIDDVEKMESLCVFSEKKKPKGQIALKFPPNAILTKINGVEFSYKGRYSISMVALIDPVEIDGTIVKRASLKSYRWVIKNKVGIGSVVEVIKAGDIIPKIVRAVTAGVRDFDYPDTCQYCDGKIYSGTAQLFCSNPNCPATEAAKIYHFLKVLGVKSLAWKSLLRYIQSGITLINFAAKDWDVIQDRVKSNPDISKVIWRRVRNKLEEF